MTPYPDQPDNGDWQALKPLEEEALRSGQIGLTSDVKALLQKVGPGLVITKEELSEALTDPAAAAGLVIEMRKRIRHGSRQLMTALAEANRLREAGQFNEARELLENLAKSDLLLPFYRQIAEAQSTVLGSPTA